MLHILNEGLNEEIHYISGNDHRNLTHHLKILFTHLLKWQYQSMRGGKHWFLTIKEHRTKVNGFLKKLNSEGLINIIDKAYRIALIEVTKETNLPKHIFPDSCPWLLEEITSHSFFPL